MTRYSKDCKIKYENTNNKKEIEKLDISTKSTSNWIKKYKISSISGLMN